jgi:energy-coupling factor transport system substrate-specific component
MRLSAISACGLALFLWPFFGTTLPTETAALVLAIACAAALLLVEVGTRSLDSRGVALLAALAAVDTGLRLATEPGIAGFSPAFFLILCGGYVFGPSYGFLLGAFTLLVSSLVTSGIGPWVPNQVFAAGWVGVIAGLAGQLRRAPLGWRDLAVLAVVGAVCGWGYGAVMDVFDWTNFYRGTPVLGWVPGIAPPQAIAHFARFYLVTSLAYDTFRAVGNVLLILVLGAPVLAALSRLRARMTFTVVPA